MGKTYKKYPKHFHRRPRGRTQALINEARHGAVPPDAWDDIPHCSSAMLPFNVARKMVLQGKWDLETIAHKLSKKFHLSYKEALDLMWPWVK
jgi:hypothetical protein